MRAQAPLAFDPGSGDGRQHGRCLHGIGASPNLFRFSRGRFKVAHTAKRLQLAPEELQRIIPPPKDIRTNLIQYYRSSSIRSLLLDFSALREGGRDVFQSSEVVVGPLLLLPTGLRPLFLGVEGAFGAPVFVVVVPCWKQGERKNERTRSC